MLLNLAIEAELSDWERSKVVHTYGYLSSRKPASLGSRCAKDQAYKQHCWSI
jgi:hypothetical protein